MPLIIYSDRVDYPIDYSKSQLNVQKSIDGSPTIYAPTTTNDATSIKNIHIYSTGNNTYPAGANNYVDINIGKGGKIKRFFSTQIGNAGDYGSYEIVDLSTGNTIYTEGSAGNAFIVHQNTAGLGAVILAVNVELFDGKINVEGKYRLYARNYTAGIGMIFYVEKYDD